MKNAPGRILGKTEYFYWLYNQLECTNFVISVTLDKLNTYFLTEECLEKTIRRYSRMQEKTVVSGRHTVRFSELNKYRTNVDYRLGDRDGYKEILCRELAKRFKHDQIPVRALLYLTFPEKKLSLSLIFDHTFTDAKGALSIMSDLLGRLYGVHNNKEETKVKSLPPQEYFFPASVKGWHLARFILKKKLLNNKRVEGEGDPKIINRYFCSGQERSISLQRKVIDKTLTRNISIACRIRDVSVGSFIAAIQNTIIRDIIELEGNIPVSLNIPVDNRSELLPECIRQDPGLYITIPHITSNIGRNENIWKLAREINSEIKNILASEDRYTSFQLFPQKLFPANREGVMKLKNVLVKKPVTSTLTNLGKVETGYKNLNNLPVTSLEFGVAPSVNDALCTSVIYFKGRIYINCYINNSLISKDQSNDIMDRYFARIAIMSGMKEELTP